MFTTFIAVAWNIKIICPRYSQRWFHKHQYTLVIFIFAQIRLTLQKKIDRSIKILLLLLAHHTAIPTCSRKRISPCWWYLFHCFLQSGSPKQYQNDLHEMKTSQYHSLLFITLDLTTKPSHL